MLTLLSGKATEISRLFICRHVRAWSSRIAGYQFIDKSGTANNSLYEKRFFILVGLYRDVTTTVAGAGFN
ncbi:hypothetical protein [Chitinophaga filiformis]|uniref:Uncharacterized protein n=1 Tax=Chitinophaga filiformis TaxID=104663 RepID=A0ABY4HU93_CHIFI|nr:hypothetical protein [Chitinophaga filiformis]UPK67353.1 hypothetical protein MYF79_20645 [Chitinophaga filiformis]